MSEITVNTVRKFNMAELKSELSKRGLSVNEKKGELLKILAEANREVHSESIDNSNINEADAPGARPEIFEGRGGFWKL